MSRFATPCGRAQAQNKLSEHCVVQSIETPACGLLGHSDKPKKPHHSVAVVHADNELLEVPPGVRLWQPLGPAHQAEQVAARRILHRDCQVVRRQKHLRCGDCRRRPLDCEVSVRNTWVAVPRQETHQIDALVHLAAVQTRGCHIGRQPCAMCTQGLPGRGAGWRTGSLRILRCAVELAMPC